MIIKNEELDSYTQQVLDEMGKSEDGRKAIAKLQATAEKSETPFMAHMRWITMRILVEKEARKWLAER